jgi:membrane fusion protein (multidrug efflux system)
MQYIFLLFTVMLLAACNSQAGGNDKASELEKLKQQQQNLDNQIKSLENELGVKPDTSESTAKATAVEITELQTQAFRHFLEIQGTIEAKDNIGVSPKQPGIIQQVNVVEGQQVGKGTLLATLDDAIFQQGLQELQTGLEFARTIYAKQKSLWDKQIGTEVQYLTAKNNVETIERKLATLHEQAELYKIYAPISGVVDEVNVKMGEGAMVGMPAFRIVNLNNVKVSVNVAENYTGKARVGNNVEITLPDLNKTLNGKISKVGTIINPIDRTFNIEVAVPNSGDLRPNMIAMIKLQDYGNANSIVIPINAVQNSEEGSYVFVVDNKNGAQIARKQLIKTGMIYGAAAEVTEGLKIGDKIVTTGYQELVNGQLIKF